jgi:capsular polysaccharide biosynthesis protein
MPRWKRSDKLTEESALGRGSMYSPQLILQTLRQRMWTIMLVALVTTGSAIGFSLLQTPTYESSVLIQVGEKTTGDTNSALDVADLQELTLTVAKAVPTTPVAEAVVERLEDPPEGGAGAVLANSSAEPDPGTVFVNVSYRASDPERAQLIADTIGIVLSEKIPEMNLGANAITATVWEPATLPETPLSPDPIRNGIIGLMLGSLLGLVLVFLFEHVSDRWKSRDELEEDFGVPTLGVVPKFRVSARRKEALVSKEGER